MSFSLHMTYDIYKWGLGTHCQLVIVMTAIMMMVIMMMMMIVFAMAKLVMWAS